MAPPDVNLERQKRRHKPPLVILAVVVALVFLGFLWWMFFVTGESDEPTVEVPAETTAPAAPAN